MPKGTGSDNSFLDDDSNTGKDADFSGKKTSGKHTSRGLKRKKDDSEDVLMQAIREGTEADVKMKSIEFLLQYGS